MIVYFFIKIEREGYRGTGRDWSRVKLGRNHQTLQQAAAHAVQNEYTCVSRIPHSRKKRLPNHVERLFLIFDILDRFHRIGQADAEER